ncbi:hypothetical protein [Sulfolobus spindle-shaped virus]|nr:hypothetical protein [Sulfolobus spindle-shaped virus]AZG04122.1 hypothetical protein [Sulfolobus spindle-shaped virus]
MRPNAGNRIETTYITSPNALIKRKKRIWLYKGPTFCACV